MADFPWEILKAETLRSLSHELGIKRNLKREDAIAFLRAVQKKGLGPALADEIVKDFTTVSFQVSNEDGINGRGASSSAPTSPLAKSSATKSSKLKHKPAPIPVSPRRISTRKRLAPDQETYEPSFNSTEQNHNEDEDAEGETDHEVPESASMAGRNTRHRGVKRVRVSEPVPEAGPARSTRSRKDAGPSTSVSTSAPVVEKRTTRASANASSTSPNVNGGEKRSSRRLRVKADRAETEDEEEEEEEEEDGGKGERFTGPKALAAALTQASTQSRTPRVRSRPPKSSHVTTTVSAPPRTRATASTRSKTRLETTSRTRSSSDSRPTMDSPRTSKRTIKPTAKGALLNPIKRPMTILSRPIRTQVVIRQQQQRQARAKRGPPGRKVLDSVTVPRVPALVNGEGRSESPREIFDGVVLKKRKVRGNVQDGYGMQLDEFVANGLVRQDEENETGGLVLDRDEVSSLGGSNKENDFSFRNAVSESSEDPEDHLPVGDEDAEGEPELEPEGDTAMLDVSQLQPQPELQLELELPQQQMEMVQPQPTLDLDPVHRSPLQEVSQVDIALEATEPEAEMQVEEQLLSEPQPELQPSNDPVAEPEVTVQLI
ncbi:hypothetical protein P691DRAFT_808974 [Macrolepiota fuliginosa MF-IS2]|uniref:Uncharacterized protein n=1 Tax=Macrolepiota fuliginosa MF-IS2 TaxID=1400762 RepID=A0A9P6BZH1_9AGAR|nr:hypothetical protein P691DRAFT_808974 [Macrolepiota fuliginosa MF-IS2]